MIDVVTIMKKIIVFLYAIILLNSCYYSKSTNDVCQIPDTRIIGTWKLVKKCLCYNNGGDWVWRNFKGSVTFSFNDQCVVAQSDSSRSTCNEGKYSIKSDTIAAVFNCGSSAKVKDIWLYSFNPKNDTLTLKEFVDEGYFGFKYVKTTDKVN
jgi:hypothetical protein